MKVTLSATFLAIVFLASSCLGQNNGMMGLPGTPEMGDHINSVSGVVLDSSGNPIPDAHVEIHNLQNGNTVAAAYTNSAGAFEFATLPGAVYDLVASHGLAQTHERIDATSMVGTVRVRLDTRNSQAAEADGRATVSVAEYRIPEKARDALHKAEEALNKGKQDEVSKYLDKALKICPNYAAALTLHGVLALDASRTQEAINDFDHAIKADNSYALAYTAMAAALNASNRFDEALRSSDRATALAPASWQPYFEMAKSYFGKQDYQHTLQELDRARQLLPKDYPPLHLVRAHALLGLKDYKGAVAQLQDFITLAPKDPNSSSARETLEKVKAFTASAAHAPMASLPR
ncbi:MAG TPA: carboxypeptidase regulatory-like domain-containing protein [Terriglobales bacterium]|nr:carboxypeptidase regulatory-like domain-containing protein [Terriglobales bacterium]